MTIVGTAVVLCGVLVGLLIVSHPFAGRAAGLISVVIDTPYVGQGVAKGTPVVMHGVTVGEVTAVSSLPSGGVRLNADLQKKPVAGLTATMNIDFRPVNYFGVTGINLIAGTGGQPLRDGTQINTVPKGNFTLQALLSRLGEESTGVLTPQLIQVIDKATRYTDALDPLIETVLIAGNAVARVQTVSTERLLTNTTGLSVAFPSTFDALVGLADALLNNDDTLWHIGSADVTAEEWEQKFLPTQKVATTKVLGLVGKLEASHLGDLISVVDSVNALTDVVPPLIRPEGFAKMLAELRSRFEKMYAGTPEQRALRVRIVLDSLPGVAGPLSAMGGP
ncbi:MlaD family protein [Mycobacterium sp. MFM001]|uniref:MlaD family protein n=1 Tax=Mycobacterium sp. MFM001 TaxID=2049453 RepID=UPI001EDCAFA0